MNRNFLLNSQEELLRGKDHWPNQQRDRFPEELAISQKHGITPFAPGDPRFHALITSGGRFNWAVLLDGTLRIAPSIVVGHDGPARISHAILVPDGSAVLAAGEGKLGAFLSNTTGHYKNEAFVVPPVKKAFAALGFEFVR